MTATWGKDQVNAVVYARYSSRAQGEQSIEGQLEKAHAYAANKGYRIVHEYVDRAQSGRTDKRDEFQQMLKDTAKKQFQVIILWKVDRFGRNREEIALNKIKCKRNGVRVEYVAESIPDSPEGVILESVLEGIAEYYSLQLSQNVRRGQAISAQKCQAVGGVHPLGYLVGPDKKYVIDPKTGPTVKLIFDMYSKGSTVTEIIKHLNEQGLTNTKGKPFTRNSLYSILNNEKYTGVYTYGDVRIEGGMPVIVEPELFKKVQDLMKVNRRAPSHKWSRADYLLTDKLFCGKCGTAMVGECGTSKSGATYNYYICSKRKRFRQCDKKAVRKEWIEKIVLREIKKIVSDDELLEFIGENTHRYYMDQNAAEEELRIIREKIAEVEAGIDNIVRAIEAGMFNPALKKRMDELEEQRNTLLTSAADIEITQVFKIEKEHILFFLHEFRNYDFNDLDCQRRLIATFVNAIYLYDDKIVITFNYSGDSRTVTLAEIDAVTEGEVFGCCAPLSVKKKVTQWVAFFFTVNLPFGQILFHFLLLQSRKYHFGEVEISRFS